MDLVTAVGLMKTTYEAAKTAMQVRDEAKMNAALGEMAQRITDLQLAGFETSGKLVAQGEEVAALKGKLAELEAKAKLREQYQLVAVREGAFVYEYKAEEGDSTPPHYACQVCLDEGRRVVLVQSIGGTWLDCPHDPKHKVQAKPAPKLNMRRGQVGDSGGWMAT